MQWDENDLRRRKLMARRKKCLKADHLLSTTVLSLLENEHFLLGAGVAHCAEMIAYHYHFFLMICRDCRGVLFYQQGNQLMGEIICWAFVMYEVVVSLFSFNSPPFV